MTLTEKILNGKIHFLCSSYFQNCLSTYIFRVLQCLCSINNTFCASKKIKKGLKLSQTGLVSLSLSINRHFPTLLCRCFNIPFRVHFNNWKTIQTFTFVKIFTIKINNLPFIERRSCSYLCLFFLYHLRQNLPRSVIFLKRNFL